MQMGAMTTTVHNLMNEETGDQYMSYSYMGQAQCHMSHSNSHDGPFARMDQAQYIDVEPVHTESGTVTCNVWEVPPMKDDPEGDSTTYYVDQHDAATVVAVKTSGAQGQMMVMHNWINGQEGQWADKFTPPTGCNMAGRALRGNTAEIGAAITAAKAVFGM